MVFLSSFLLVIACDKDQEIVSSKSTDSVEEALVDPIDDSESGKSEKTENALIEGDDGKEIVRLCDFHVCKKEKGQAKDKIPLTKDGKLSFSIALNSRHTKSPYETTSDGDGTPKVVKKKLSLMFLVDGAKYLYPDSDSAFKSEVEAASGQSSSKLKKLVEKLKSLDYEIDYEYMKIPDHEDSGSASFADDDIDTIAELETKIKDTTGYDIDTKNLDLKKAYLKAFDEIKKDREVKKYYILILLTSDKSILELDQRIGVSFKLFLEDLKDKIEEKELKYLDRIKFINIVADGLTKEHREDNPLSFNLSDYKAQKKKVETFLKLLKGFQDALSQQTDTALTELGLDKKSNQSTVFAHHFEDDPDSPYKPSKKSLEKAFEISDSVEDLDTNSSIFGFVNHSIPNLDLDCLLTNIEVDGEDPTDQTKISKEREVSLNLGSNQAVFRSEDKNLENTYSWRDIMQGGHPPSSITIKTKRCCIDMKSADEKAKFDGETHALDFFSKDKYPKGYDDTQENGQDKGYPDPVVTGTKIKCYTTSKDSLKFKIER